MAQTDNQSSDVVMGLFGFISSVIGAYAVNESLAGDNGSAWVFWMLVAVGGGMVMGVALNNILLGKAKIETKKAEPTKKPNKPVRTAKKKKVNG